MKADKLLLELEDLLLAKGYRIRRERGNFRSGNCLLEGEKLIMLNKMLPPETQVASICALFNQSAFDDQFVKPAVRKELDKYWDRLHRMKTPELWDNPTDEDQA
jgi:hypothetical protein